MSTIATTPVAATLPAQVLADYRDDGPIAAALGRALGARVAVAPLVLTLVGAAPLVATLMVRPGMAVVSLGAALGWYVVLAGVAGGRSLGGRLGWLVPPLLRAVEYATLARLAGWAGGDAEGHCLALLGVLAFAHYDTVYRLRHQRRRPPRWRTVVGGGWDGRLLLAGVLQGSGILSPGLVVAACVLGTAYLLESTISWLQFRCAQRPPLHGDEEDEDE